MTARKLVVIGGIAAGLSAAVKAKRLQPGIEVTVYEKGGYASTGACGLPYYVGGTTKTAEELLAVSPQDLGEKRGIKVLTEHEVTAIAPEKKSIDVTELATGRQFTDTYDELVIATGASPVLPNISGLDSAGVYVLRTLEDGLALRRAVESGAKRAVIVGGGLIGLEVAEQLREAGLGVVVIEALPKLLPFLESDYAERICHELAKQGVAVIPGATVESVISDSGQATALRLSDGREIPTDIVLISAGVKPNSSLAIACGAEIGVRGAVAVDERMRTTVPHIWACGDCAAARNIITGESCWIPAGTTANKQGRVAGANIGGEDSVFPGVLGSQTTKVFDLYVAATGLNTAKAREAGFDASSVSIIKSDRASYYPGGRDTHLTLIFSRTDGRLLGAQALGGPSVAGRVNTLVAAITAGMTVSELNDLDLLYSPAVAPVYDPILIAAASAVKQVVK